MPNYSYAFQNFDKTKHVRAALREKDISHKHSREVAVAIKGMSIEKARDFLNDGFFAGRFPQKAAKEFLKLLDNLETNAEYKGMDLDRLRIISAVVHKGTRLERFTPRAMGRASPKFDSLIHVELVAQEGRSI